MKYILKNCSEHGVWKMKWLWFSSMFRYGPNVRKLVIKFIKWRVLRLATSPRRNIRFIVTCGTFPTTFTFYAESKMVNPMEKPH